MSKQKINNENLAADYPIPGPSDQPTHCTVCKPPLGQVPTRMICPYCGKTMLTKVKTKVEKSSWFRRCCFYFIPCFMDSFKETTKHYCSNCNAKLGTVEIPRL